MAAFQAEPGKRPRFVPSPEPFEAFESPIHPKFEEKQWMPGILLTSGLFTAAWGYLVYTGDISTIWPLFGMVEALQQESGFGRTVSILSGDWIGRGHVGFPGLRVDLLHHPHLAGIPPLAGPGSGSSHPDPAHGRVGGEFDDRGLDLLFRVFRVRFVLVVARGLGIVAPAHFRVQPVQIAVGAADHLAGLALALDAGHGAEAEPEHVPGVVVL